MKKLLIILLSLMLVGCAMAKTRPSPLTELIRNDQVNSHRYLIAGDGVSEEDVAELARGAGAYIVYGASRNPLSDLVKTTLTHTAGPSYMMNMLMEDLRAMRESGQKWDIIVADHAYNFFIRMMKYMQEGELAGTKGTIYVADRNVNNKDFESVVRRVYGDIIAIKFVKGNDKVEWN
jgi:hypothetical protein